MLKKAHLQSSVCSALNHGQRTGVVECELRSPARDAGVVHRMADNEEQLCSLNLAKAFRQCGVRGDLEPVSGRRCGVWTVGPVLGNDLVDDVQVSR